MENTDAVCHCCYVHQAVIESYLSGRMIDACREPDEDCERAVLDLLVEQAKEA